MWLWVRGFIQQPRWGWKARGDTSPTTGGGTTTPAFCSPSSALGLLEGRTEPPFPGATAPARRPVSIDWREAGGNRSIPVFWRNLQIFVSAPTSHVSGQRGQPRAGRSGEATATTEADKWRVSMRAAVCGDSSKQEPPVLTRSTSAGQKRFVTCYLRGTFSF